MNIQTHVYIDVIRKKRFPQKFKSFFIDKNISKNESVQSENNYRIKLFLLILDKIINKLVKQF